jgi:hypothetical protein
MNSLRRVSPKFLSSLRIEKRKVHMVFKFGRCGSSIEKFQGDGDSALSSSGVRNILMPLSYLSVLDTYLSQRPR